MKIISYTKFINSNKLIIRGREQRPRLRPKQDLLRVWLVTKITANQLQADPTDPEMELLDGQIEWVSANRLAEIATVELGTPISACHVGMVLRKLVPQIKRRKLENATPIGRGRIKYRKSRSIYHLGPHLGGTLSEISQDTA